MVKIRGQAALDFIMTYGWALGAVIAVMGALTYFGFLDTSQFMQDECDISLSFECSDILISSSGKAMVRFTNSIGRDIIVNNVTYVSDGEQINCILPEGNSKKMERGESQTFHLVNCGTNIISGRKYKGKLLIDYEDLESRFPNRLHGVVVSQTEGVDLELPKDYILPGEAAIEPKLEGEPEPNPEPAPLLPNAPAPEPEPKIEPEPMGPEGSPEAPPEGRHLDLNIIGMTVDFDGNLVFGGRELEQFNRLSPAFIFRVSTENKVLSKHPTEKNLYLSVKGPDKDDNIYYWDTDMITQMTADGNTKGITSSDNDLLDVDTSGNMYYIAPLDGPGAFPGPSDEGDFDFESQVIKKIDQAKTVTTLAGGGTNSEDGVKATDARINPQYLAVHSKSGQVTVYFIETFDYETYKLRQVTSDGKINTLAALEGVAGEMTVDSGGNVYYTNGYNKVYKWKNGADNFEVFAGTDETGKNNGDGLQATKAALFEPSLIAADKQGSSKNVFIKVEFENNVKGIRYVDKDNLIHTLKIPEPKIEPVEEVEIPFNSITKDWIYGLSLDTSGNIIFGAGDSGGRGLFKYNPVTLKAYRISHTPGVPVSTTFDAIGNIYFVASNIIYKFDSKNKQLIKIAGGGTSTEDNIPALQAKLADPPQAMSLGRIASDKQGNIYLPIRQPAHYTGKNNYIRKLTPKEDGTYTISNFAGGDHGYVDGPLSEARFSEPTDIFISEASGKPEFFIMETHYQPIDKKVVRKIKDNQVKTITSTSSGSYSIVDMDPSGFFYLRGTQDRSTYVLDPSLAINNVIKIAGQVSGIGGVIDKATFDLYLMVQNLGFAKLNKYGAIYNLGRESEPTIPSPTEYTLRKVAGNAHDYYHIGDGGLATRSQIYKPKSVFVDKNDNIYITDDSFRIRKVFAENEADYKKNHIYTIAGTGVKGYRIEDEGKPALESQFGDLGDVVVDSKGNVYVYGSQSRRIRKIYTTDEGGFQKGHIYTIASNLGLSDMAIGSDDVIYFAQGTEVKSLVKDIEGLYTINTLANLPKGLEFITVAKNGDIYTSARTQGSGYTPIYKITKENEYAVTDVVDDVAPFELRLGWIQGLKIDSNNHIYGSEWTQQYIRKLVIKEGAQDTLDAIAGTGRQSFLSPGSDYEGPARQAPFYRPKLEAIGPDDSLYLLDGGKILRVYPPKP